jgi:hypothetical protein
MYVFGHCINTVYIIPRNTELDIRQFHLQPVAYNAGTEAVPWLPLYIKDPLYVENWI